jgi:hypothetical protein
MKPVPAGAKGGHGVMAGSVAEPDSRLRVLDTGEQLPLVQQLQRQGLVQAGRSAA